MSPATGIAVFNSPLDVGLRALCVLAEAFPVACDLERLTFYDYLLVHSGDIPGAPASIHPPIPNRSGELLIRRALVDNALTLMARRGLICIRYGEAGIGYHASEEATPFLKCLQAAYTLQLRARASWVISTFGGMTNDEIKHLVDQNLGNWGAEYVFSISEYEAD